MKNYSQYECNLTSGKKIKIQLQIGLDTILLSGISVLLKQKILLSCTVFTGLQSLYIYIMIILVINRYFQRLLARKVAESVAWWVCEFSGQNFFFKLKNKKKKTSHKASFMNYLALHFHLSWLFMLYILFSRKSTYKMTQRWVALLSNDVSFSSFFYMVVMAKQDLNQRPWKFE